MIGIESRQQSEAGGSAGLVWRIMKHLDIFASVEARGEEEDDNDEANKEVNCRKKFGKNKTVRYQKNAAAEAGEIACQIQVGIAGCLEESLFQRVTYDGE